MLPAAGCMAMLLSVYLVVFSFAFPVAMAQQATVSGELSASTITRDETVVLTITAIGMDAELDASSLNKDFDVVGRSSSREVRMISGANNQISNTSVVRWSLELLPKDVGVFTVPAVKVGDLYTQLLTLTVNDVPQGAKRDIFVEATVDTTQPWVQSQVVMTVSVFQAVDIVDGGLDIPAGDNLVVERIGEDTRTRQVRDGREYSVTERRFALFAQKSGVLEIEPITLNVTVPADPTRVRGFFSPTRKLTRRTLPITLNVLPRPDATSAWWLPASAVQLEAQWAAQPLDAQVDKPLTRTIVLRVEGVLDSQLPEIAIPAIDGVSLYAEEPQRAMGPSASGLVAEQRINWALIPQRSGSLELPAISVEWFNTQTGKIETATLAAERIDVSPNTASSGSPAGQQPAGSAAADAMAGGVANGNELAMLDGEGATSETLAGRSDSMPEPGVKSGQLSTGESVVDNSLGNAGVEALSKKVAGLEASLDNWRVLAFLASGLWLATLLYFAWRRWGGSNGNQAFARAGIASAGNKTSDLYRNIAPLSSVESACKSGNPSVLKQALIEWAGGQWPDSPPATLRSLTHRLPEGEARQTIVQLDSVLYGQSDNDDSASALSLALSSLPAQLKDAMHQLRQSSATIVSSKKRRELPSL